ncbi:zinc finger and SCAN domain-containing protein 20-like [Chrysemys picta bellii]|uniref:zinc finger and SCAN domain-containing protein 20-like n=1 Tax=Chrysemys picta bellii TaxID=8478 RepID=UPI0032B162A7
MTALAASLSESHFSAGKQRNLWGTQILHTCSSTEFPQEYYVKGWSTLSSFCRWWRNIPVLLFSHWWRNSWVHTVFLCRTVGGRFQTAWLAVELQISLEEAQVAMPAPRTRRSSAWSNADLLDIIGIWGEEAIQSQLRSSHRNYDTYGQISRCMTERGHARDTLQCRVKVKELRNTYHKAREANRRSGAVPTSCWFYKELDVILGSGPTSTAKTPVDTSVARVPVESGPSQEEEILDKEGEGDPEAEDDSEVRDAGSQELFSTPEEASQSQQLDLGGGQTGSDFGNR